MKCLHTVIFVTNQSGVPSKLWLHVCVWLRSASALRSASLSLSLGDRSLLGSSFWQSLSSIYSVHWSLDLMLPLRPVPTLGSPTPTGSCRHGAQPWQGQCAHTWCTPRVHRDGVDEKCWLVSELHPRKARPVSLETPSRSPLISYRHLLALKRWPGL